MAIYGYNCYIDIVKSPLGMEYIDMHCTYRTHIANIAKGGYLVNFQCQFSSPEGFHITKAGTPRDPAPVTQEVPCFGGGMEKVS